MATIPKYSRQVGLPGEGPNVMVPIRDNTGIGDALQSVGRGIEEYGEAERSRLAVEKQQNDFIAATSMENDFLGGLIEREKEWSTRLGANAEGITEEAIKHVEERAETYSRNASDPKAAELIRNRILDHGRSFVKRAESYSRQQRQVRFDTEQDATMGKYQEMTYGDFTRLETSISGVQKFYKDAVANKTMTPEQAELKSKDMANKLTASALDGMMDRPEERELAVKWFKEGKFDGLGTLKNKYAEKIDRLAESIEKDKKEIAIKLERERELAEIQTRQAKADELYDKYRQGKLTRQDIALSALPGVPGTKIDPQHTQKVFDDLLDNREEKAKKASEKATKQATKQERDAAFNTLFVSVLTDPKNVDPNDIDDAIRSGEITPQKGSMLKDKLAKAIKTDDPERKEHMKYSEREIMKVIKDPVEQTDVLDLMDRWLDRNPDKDPKDYLKKVMEPYRTKIVEGLLDFAFDLKPKADPARRAKEIDAELSSGTDPKRQKAVDILKKNGKPVTERNIGYIMGQIK